MGARIAAHLANAGIPCYLLDIVPRELNADEKRKGLTLESPAVRNRIVLAGLEAAKKSRPAAFFTPETARLVTPGNFEDNLAWCGAGRLDHRGGRRKSRDQAQAFRARRRRAQAGNNRHVEYFRACRST